MDIQPPEIPLPQFTVGLLILLLFESDGGSIDYHGPEYIALALQNILLAANLESFESKEQRALVLFGTLTLQADLAEEAAQELEGLPVLAN